MLYVFWRQVHANSCQVLGFALGDIFRDLLVFVMGEVLLVCNDCAGCRHFLFGFGHIKLCGQRDSSDSNFDTFRITSTKLFNISQCRRKLM